MARNVILTTGAAAGILGVTPGRIRAMIRAGQIPAKRHGARAYIIHERDLDRVMDRKPGRPKRGDAA